MATQKFKDRDRLNVMQQEVDSISMVYGANGHYSVGGYYNLFGNGYNTEAIVKSAESTEAAVSYNTLTDEEKLAKGTLI